MDSRMFGSRARQAFTMLDLPAPEGAATTKRVPRVGSGLIVWRPPSFDVLDLFAHLVDQHLQLDRRGRRARIDRLAAQRVRLAVELLQQEIEAATHRVALREHAAD